MRGITLGVFSTQPIYDVDFQTNVLDVAQTMGYAIPPLENRWLLNRLMKDMKDIGFFQIQDTLANFALGITGYEQFMMIDWKKTGNIYTPYGGLTFKPDGAEGNGIDAYIDTNFNPATMGINYTLNDASRNVILSFVSGTGTTTGYTIDGISAHYTRNNMYSMNTNNHRLNTTNGIPGDLSGIGYKSIGRQLGSNLVLLINKELESTFSRAAQVLDNSTQVILARGPLDTVNTPNYSKGRISSYSMGGYMEPVIHQLFRTIYNQYLSRIGLSPIA